MTALLSGPPPGHGAEPFADHAARLGPLPTAPDLIATLERAELRGRGGAGFPVAAKWASVAGRRRGAAVVLANGAEGEPLSRKDRLLMETRPHLVIDGAVLAARAVDADELILYIGEEHPRAVARMGEALRERRDLPRGGAGVVSAPVRYVSGEESAAVHFVNDGVALPTSTPPRPYEKGVRGRATVVQNVESLAHAALIARYGDEWFRSLGRDASTGTALITVSGCVAQPGVVEVAQGTSLAEAVAAAGGATGPVAGVLLGGYFGGWVATETASDLRLDSAWLRARRLSLGCGIVSLLPADRCGVAATSRILTYLAGESAQQCGPCVFGLRAIAEAMERVAGFRSLPDDVERLSRWGVSIRGRGACKHPDGAAGLLQSALSVFAAELALHHNERRCSVGGAVEVVAWNG